MFFRKIDSKRIKDCNPDVIHAFFYQYEAILDHRQIKPKNI